MFSIKTNSESELQSLGESIGKLVYPGLIILLNGDLGAGKTVLARGIARGLGIDTPIKSPTFNIMKVYNGRLPYYHFDLYRIEDEGEFDELGLDEFFYGSGVSAIEWPERLPELPITGLDINVERSGDGRETTITGKDGSAEALLRELEKAYTK